MQINKNSFHRITSTLSRDFLHYTYDPCIDLYKIPLKENIPYKYNIFETLIWDNKAKLTGGAIITIIPADSAFNIITVTSQPAYFEGSNAKLHLRNLIKILEIPWRIFPNSHKDVLSMCGSYDIKASLIYAEKWIRYKIGKSINQKG